MKKIKILLIYILLISSITISHSQDITKFSVNGIIDTKSQSWILNSIINPIMSFVLSIAVLVFFYGTVKFILNRNNPEQNSNNKKAMFWGLIGIFIIASVWQIMDLVAASVGSAVRLK